MRPSWHVLAGGGLGLWMYQITQNWQLALGAAVTEVLMDLDHLIEYFTWNKRRFCLRTFLSSYNTFRYPRTIYIFHSYEFIILLAIIAWHSGISLFWAITWGTIVHILLDEIGNRLPSLCVLLSPRFYFFSYRLLRGFRTDALVSRKINNVSEVKEVSR